MNKIWKIVNEEQFYKNILCKKKEQVFTIISDTEKETYYENIIKIQKKNGFREICVIDKSNEIYNIQKNLKNNLLNHILVSDVAYGFVKKSNYYDFLMPHVNFYKKNFYLRLDIKDFFGSIRYEDIEDVMSYYFEETFDEESKRSILNIMCDIMTFKKKVMQGTPTAPILSNIIFRPIDIRIQRYCQRYGIIYSRYADDLLFSSEDSVIFSGIFQKGIQEILKSKNFYINYNKTIRSKNYVSLNGYVIDSTIRLSRSKLKDLNRVLFYLENIKFGNKENWLANLNNGLNKYDKQGNKIIFTGKYEVINYLAGNRAFLISSIKYSENNMYLDRCKRMIYRIEKQIDCLLL